MNNQMPLVSVLTTTYNREKYVAEAIDSILSSTYQNFELIIVDDCSSDQTIEIVKNYATRDSRIRYYVNDNNLGDYPNRNRAASYAKGKYIKYVDADDIIYPHCLEVMVKCMEFHPRAGWGCSGKHINPIFPLPKELNPRETFLHHYFRENLFNISPLESIIKRETFQSIGGFIPRRMVGDFDMWFRLSMIAHTVILPTGLTWYRRHDDQEINQYHKYIKEYDQIEVSYLLSDKIPISSEEIRKVFKRKQRILFRAIVMHILMRKWSDVKSFIERWGMFKKNSVRI